MIPDIKSPTRYGALRADVLATLPEPPLLLTAKQAVALLSMSPHDPVGYLRKMGVPIIRMGPRRRAVKRSDIIDLVDRKHAEAAADR